MLNIDVDWIVMEPDKEYVTWGRFGIGRMAFKFCLYL